MNKTTVPTLQIILYQSFHQPFFEKLNRDWIEKFFWMEPLDEQILQEPEKYIIEPGGHVYMAVVDSQVAGTVALRFISDGIFELTKMAVDEKYRGMKVGETLARFAIEQARKMHATEVFLYSNTVLATAINLYKKIGFLEIPVDGPYKRSNIKMQLKLV